MLSKLAFKRNYGGEKGCCLFGLPTHGPHQSLCLITATRLSFLNQMIFHQIELPGPKDLSYFYFSSISSLQNDQICLFEEIYM